MGCFALLINVVILNFLVFQPLVRATYYFKYETDVESTTPPKSIIYHLLKSNFNEILFKSFCEIQSFLDLRFTKSLVLFQARLSLSITSKITPFLQNIMVCQLNHYWGLLFY